MKVRKLLNKDYEEMKKQFIDVFSNEPWFDKWENDQKVDRYMKDISTNKNSLSLALYGEDDELIGCSLGLTFNWWEGKEYFIKEFFISRKHQKQGIGSIFLSLMEDVLKEEEIQHILLTTEKTVPAYLFYQKNGFRTLTDSVLLVKNLPN
ncbi:GNAT family N-acetyltransferase [Alkalihalobacillus trypoxylicola]|uniref:N-acetyltransferase domain-containing protein n=1 Tax=Alkalihalobacillus trypoxylicola TaxID=519424 RepID=A0A161QD43_9BACI|nr:GNAT family N-acetyltransferase [Alkalihalobacillus trypoxylicola]KYG26065.1 hypothetical protein AZF04_13345 [Alkalihalobacillus trypoxylicola]